MVKIKLLLIPFPPISSYCNQGVKFNEILAFLKKMHCSVVPASKAEGSQRSPVLPVGKESASFVPVLTLMQVP